MTLAERHSGSVLADRREYGWLLLVVRLLVDRQRGNLPAVATDVRELQVMTEVADASRRGLGADLSTLALISLGGTEFWADAYDDAARHLEQGVALARRIGRPYLEFTGLAQWSAVAVVESFSRAVELGMEAAELAERHGWTGDPAFGPVAASLGAVLTWQWRAEEAERWLQTAERILGADQPGMAAAMRFVRGDLELLRNRDSAAVAAFQAADLLAGRLASPHMLIPWIRALLLLAMVRLGQTEPAGQFLAGLSDTDRERGEIRSVSPNTVRTHIRHMHAKLGTHHRAETVELARAVGLLAPSRTGRATARPE